MIDLRDKYRYLSLQKRVDLNNKTGRDEITRSVLVPLFRATPAQAVAVFIKVWSFTVKSPHKNKRKVLLFLHSQEPDCIFSIVLIAIYKKSNPKENPNNVKVRGLNKC